MVLVLVDLTVECHTRPENEWMMLASSSLLCELHSEIVAVYRSPAYWPMMIDLTTICCDCLVLIATNSNCLASYSVVIALKPIAAHRTNLPFDYSIAIIGIAVMCGSMAAVNHSSCFELVAVYHMFLNRTFRKDFDTDYLSDLVSLAADHTSIRRHTFAVLLPMNLSNKRNKHNKSINMVFKSLMIICQV